MARVIFYDRFGAAVAYMDNAQTVVLFDGRPAGLIRGGSVYDYSGRHLGWLKDGWIRDHDGNAVYFASGQRGGGPVPPTPRVPPVPAAPQVPPVLAVAEVPPAPPVPSLAWSDLSGTALFED